MPLWFFLVAKAIHIVFGGFWLGSAITVGFFLVPSVRDAGPAGGAVMRQIAQVRRMPDIILWSSWIALLAGAFYLWRNRGNTRQSLLMAVLAFVMFANVAIWLVPMADGETPIEAAEEAGQD